MKDFIMQMRPLFEEEEKRAICNYMDNDYFVTEFKYTEQFEGMISAYTGSKHCVVVNNGTISLSLAALAVGIKSGDEVIVPNYTMIATPNSIKFFGGVPVFVDVDEETLCLDIDLVEKSITSKTKAIMLVSSNGRYPQSDIKLFHQLCKNNNLVLIEDAAQSLGSFYPDGRHIGTAGLVGSFSFSAPKIISTGQGGAVITDDDEVAKKLRKLKDFGRAEGGNDIHDSIGFNFKFTDIQAVIGIEQMKKLKSRVDRKKEILVSYKKNLVNLENVSFFNQDLQNTTPWFIDLMVQNRDELIKYLKTKNIGSRPMYPPINQQLAYNLPGDYPVSSKVGKNGLWLPSEVQLDDNKIDYICNSLIDFYSND